MYNKSSSSLLANKLNDIAGRAMENMKERVKPALTAFATPIFQKLEDLAKEGRFDYRQSITDLRREHCGSSEDRMETFDEVLCAIFGDEGFSVYVEDAYDDEGDEIIGQDLTISW